MRGIDISSHQAGIDVWSIDADFVIVKVSEGASYINPFWQDWANIVLERGLKLGLYHYANGGDVYSEANRFVSMVSDYIGKAILCLDWEEENNVSWGSHNQWTNPWLRHVQEITGITPFLYVQESAAGVNDTGFPRWIAQYGSQSLTGYQENPWNEGAYECEIRQYSSKGRLDGYGGNLDLNKAYITPEQWDDYAGGFNMATAQEILDKLNDTSDPTGRGMELNDHDHIKYIAAAIQDVRKDLAEIKKKLSEE